MISVLCPTRRRPKNVSRLLDSCFGTAAGPVEVVFYTDTDDSSPLELASRRRPGVTVISGPRITLSDMWNKCFERSCGDIVMQCGDDIIFRTHGWARAVTDAFAGYPDRIALVYGNDLLRGAALATHGFVHRRWVEAVGHLTPPQFSCDYGDQWLFDVAGLVGRQHYLPGVVTEHCHPAAGKAQWDRTHMERLARGQADQVDVLYERTLPERLVDAEKLRAVMR